MFTTTAICASAGGSEKEGDLEEYAIPDASDYMLYKTY